MLVSIIKLNYIQSNNNNINNNISINNSNININNNINDKNMKMNIKLVIIINQISMWNRLVKYMSVQYKNSYRRQCKSQLK